MLSTSQFERVAHAYIIIGETQHFNFSLKRHTNEWFQWCPKMDTSAGVYKSQNLNVKQDGNKSTHIKYKPRNKHVVKKKV